MNPSSPDKESKMEGDFGMYPGTHESTKSFKYNGLTIALASNYAPALDADHSRTPSESITAIASRGLNGPLVQPNGESRAMTSDSGETGVY